MISSVFSSAVFTPAEHAGPCPHDSFAFRTHRTPIVPIEWVLKEMSAKGTAKRFLKKQFTQNNFYIYV